MNSREKMMGRSWLHRSVLLLCMLMMLGLSGCTGVSHGSRDPLIQKAESTEGVAVISVTLNTSQVNAFDSIVLERISAGEASKPVLSHAYHLVHVAPGLARDTSLFIGLLKAGDYRLARLHDSTTQRFLQLDEDQRTLLGSFRIKAGSTTDLGRLILTAVNYKVVLGRSSHTSNRSLARFAPDYARWLEAPHPLGWSAPRNEHDVAERYARLHPQGTAGFSELPTGEVLAGTRMGMVLQRSTSGHWKVLGDTGMPEAILWTVPYVTADTLAVAVGELDTFLMVGIDGTLSPIDTGNLPPGNFFFVDHSPETRGWIVGLRRSQTAEIYHTESLESGNWRLIRSSNVAFSFWNGAQQAWIWKRPGGIGHADTTRPLIACYDYSRKSWIEQPTPNRRSILGVNTSHGHPVIGLLSIPGRNAYGPMSQTYLSGDCGANWNAVRSPYKVKMSPPLMLPSGTLLEVGGMFDNRSIQLSNDHGQTWVKHANSGQLDERLWSLPTVGLFSVTRGNFGVEVLRHSADEGATWTVELSNFNRRLFDTQTRHK